MSAPTNEDKESNIIIECNGFSRVSYTAGIQQCCLLFPDDSEVMCSTTGAYSILKQGDYELCIESSGAAMYKIPNATYSLNQTSIDKVFCCTDSQGNTFSIQSNGKALVEAPNPVHHEAFNPRYFILNDDKSAFEICNRNTIEEIILKAKADTEVAVIEDYVASETNIYSTTIIEPVSNSKTTVSYKKDSIVPYNLQRGDIILPTTDETKKSIKFGSLVGKGLMIGSYKKPPPPFKYTAPLALKYRQFLDLQSLKNDKREQVCDIVASFIHQRNEHKVKSENMQPTDHRNVSEITLADSLRMSLMDLTESRLSDVSELYKSVITNQRKTSACHPPPSMSHEGLVFIDISKSELQEANVILQSLRNKDIPPYFQSQQGKKYLFNESPPDMVSLLSKMAHGQNITKSQSTLSSSLTLTLDDSDSIPCSDTQLTPSSVKVRPVRPTPNHAEGESLPTDIGPTPIQHDIQTTSAHLALPSDTNAKTKAATSSKQNYVSFDVTGQPRKLSVSLPAAILGGRPGEQPNVKVNQNLTHPNNAMTLIWE